VGGSEIFLFFKRANNLGGLLFTRDREIVEIEGLASAMFLVLLLKEVLISQSTVKLSPLAPPGPS
jgi:hypothetical protein